MPDDSPAYPAFLPPLPNSPWTCYEASFFLLPMPEKDIDTPLYIHYRRYEQDDDGKWFLADVVIRKGVTDADL
jgi:hypothetical protein